MSKGQSEGENKSRWMYPLHAMISSRTKWEVKQCALDQKRCEGVMGRYSMFEVFSGACQVVQIRVGSNVGGP